MGLNNLRLFQNLHINLFQRGPVVAVVAHEAAFEAWEIECLVILVVIILSAVLGRSATASWPDTCIEGVLFKSARDIDKTEFTVNLGIAECKALAFELHTLSIARSAI